MPSLASKHCSPGSRDECAEDGPQVLQPVSFEAWAALAVGVAVLMAREQRQARARSNASRRAGDPDVGRRPASQLQLRRIALG